MRLKGMTSDVADTEDGGWFVLWRPALTWVVESWHPTLEAAEEAMRKGSGDLLVAKVVARKLPDAENKVVHIGATSFTQRVKDAP